MYETDQPNPDAQPPEESSNRTFLLVAGILGGIVLLSIACLAGYALVILPGQRNSQGQAATAQAQQRAQVAQALTATFQAARFPTETLTPAPTDTPVIALATATETLSALTGTPSTPDTAATATVGAALTQAARAQLTIIPTSTALPKTGIAD